VAVDDRAAGVLGIADAVRDTSAAAVAAVHQAGVRVVMLTGDGPSAFLHGPFMSGPYGA
jgi:Cu2+-exporting ATPase